MALLFDAQGMAHESLIRLRRFPRIERFTLADVKGIVVHQTDASTAQATFAAYGKTNPEELRGDVGLYETLTRPQNLSLKWLVDELVDSKKRARSEVFRHPVVSRKNPDEARRATW